MKKYIRIIVPGLCFVLIVGYGFYRYNFNFHRSVRYQMNADIIVMFDAPDKLEVRDKPKELIGKKYTNVGNLGLALKPLNIDYDLVVVERAKFCDYSTREIERLFSEIGFEKVVILGNTSKGGPGRSSADYYSFVILLE